jgi:cysteine-rich repeat protein
MSARRNLARLARILCASFTTMGLIAACTGEPPSEPVFEPACGDGIAEGDEECDDGNSDDTDACTSLCREAACGDGFVQAGREKCDDGNTLGGDACSADCQSGKGCGNGELDPGEECDDGNNKNSDACAECKNARCGDGYAQAGVEECDDGNQDDADGCTNQCKLGGAVVGSCPGVQLQVSDVKGTTVVGDTTDLKDNTAGSCGGAGAPDSVYAVVPKTSGWLVATVTGINATDPVLFVRGGDCQMGQELACSDTSGPNGSEVVILEVEAGQTYYVFVDGGVSGKGTAYSLNFQLSDDVPGDTCPGVPVTLVGGPDETVMTGDTAGATSDYKGAGACSGSGATKEIVYGVTTEVDGKLTVLLEPEFDGVLYVRVGSCSVGMQVACSDTSLTAGGPEKVVLSAVKGTKYSVFVDGYSGGSGYYKLRLKLEP